MSDIMHAILSNDQEAVGKITAENPDNREGWEWTDYTNNEQWNYVLNRLDNMEIKNSEDIIFQMVCSTAMCKMIGIWDKK